MRTFTHTTPGPVRFDLDASVATVAVHADDTTTATVTLEPANPGDTSTGALIERATVDSDGDRFTVRVPRTGAGGDGVTVVQSGRGTVNMVAGVVTGDMVGIVAGGDVHGDVTIVNGQVISGGTSVTSGGGLRIVARLPLGSSIELAGQNLTVAAHGRFERAAVTTVSGDVVVGDARDARVHTTSADVRIGHTRAADVRTVSGDAAVRALAGRARIKTVSGDITVRVVADSTLSAHSVSGDLDITTTSDAEVDSDTRTVSGRTRAHRAR